MGKQLSVEEQEIFLKGVEEKARGMTDHLDAQVNIIISISSALFIYSVTQYINSHSLIHLSLALFMGLTILLGIVTVHPFRHMRHNRNAIGLMSNRRIVKYPTHKEYLEDIKKVMNDHDLMVEEYSLAIYNAFKHYYRPKRDMYRQTRNVFAFGILFTLILVVTVALFGA